MITSNRKFGIEIEFEAPDRKSYARILDTIHCVRDGSLDQLEYATEYVSEILQGAKGVQTIQSVCEFLKKSGAKASDPKTSVHVHLDGQGKIGVLRSSRFRKDLPDNVRQIAISNRLREEVTADVVLDCLNGDYHPRRGRYEICKFNNVTYYSKAALSQAPKINYTYYYIEKPDRFKWLRNVFYFYTEFSDVMEDIVSKSRQFGNMYCIPLGASYDLQIIEAASNMEELKNVWYKGKPVGYDAISPHYDNSRYHNVNLHCFWDRHGTVEIRSHGGTIDAKKILMWVRLHQKIVDKLETMELNDIKFDGNLHKAFIDFVEEPVLQEYVKRLLGYYSDINIK
jgi:hypothetical protein